MPHPPDTPAVPLRDLYAMHLAPAVIAMVSAGLDSAFHKVQLQGEKPESVIAKVTFEIVDAFLEEREK